MTLRKQAPFLALLLLAGAVTPLAAGDLKFELGFGWTLVAPRLNATYHSQYAPPFTPAGPYISSSAEQTVIFKGKTSFGFNGFFNLLFTDNFGLQVIADYQRPGIGGSNDQYVGQVQFLFNGTPRTEAITRDWPDSAGHLSETTFSLNALARFRVADNLDLSVSAGPTVFNFEGKAGYIGYTEVQVDIQPTSYDLTGMTYETVVALDPKTKYGFNLGVEAAYKIMRQAILALDLRWYRGGSADVPMHIIEDDIYPIPAADIEAAIGLGSITVNPSYLRVGLAIRFVF
jgi:Outer membrane protein beta-barrel domain